jgi:N-acetylneuraminic acid mutarotase
LNKLYPLLATVLAFLTASSVFIVQGDVLVENSWKTMASMPTARHGLSVIGVNDKVFAIGGGGIGYLNVNELYDPLSDSWSTKQPMPTARCLFGIASNEDKIYCMGGALVGLNTVYGVNEVYNIDTDSWTTKASMPTPRTYLTANIVNGKIYLIGGSTSDHDFLTVNLNEVYDIATDTWTTKSPIPYAAQAYVSAVLNGKIYIIGGANSTSDLNYVQIYDCASDSWSYGDPLPAPLMGASASATTGFYAPEKIYVFGGRDPYNNRELNYNWVYYPQNNFWSTGAVMPTNRTGLGVANVNDMLYVIGGLDRYDKTKINERYVPFGYSEVPLKSPPPSGLSEDLPLTAVIAGIAVAATVVAVAGFVVYHFKHSPAKAAKGS